ncbi:MAG: hypothetical protein UIC63_06685, partial [Bacteroidaceae bacterium]|nr:hypothetical protein [Bacteroidaceae bacterium]
MYGGTSSGRKQYRTAILQSRKDDLGRMASHPSKTYKRKWNVCVWKISCCGIFCSPQKGSEAEGKVCGNLSSPGRVPGIC